MIRQMVATVALAAVMAGPVYGQDMGAVRAELLGPAPALQPGDRALLDLARRAQGDRTPVSIGPNGALLFQHGVGQPVVICAVLQICEIALQPGEAINNVHQSDPRWQIEPAWSQDGNGVETTHLIVKPTDVGLDSTLVVTTTRRTYNIRLKSHDADFMPRVAFIYQDADTKKWRSAKQTEIATREVATLPDTGELLDRLDFSYRVSGYAPWLPVRVYNDGTRTVIQMPAAMAADEAPVLLLLRDEGGMFRDEETALVNSRLIGDRYIVDGVFERAVLISGVGDRQQRVTIERAVKGRRQ